jgi:hypothetical protein
MNRILSTITAAGLAGALSLGALAADAARPSISTPVTRLTYGSTVNRRAILTRIGV